MIVPDYRAILADFSPLYWQAADIYRREIMSAQAQGERAPPFRQCAEAVDELAGIHHRVLRPPRGHRILGAADRLDPALQPRLLDDGLGEAAPGGLALAAEVVDAAVGLPPCRAA